MEKKSHKIQSNHNKVHNIIAQSHQNAPTSFQTVLGTPTSVHSKRRHSGSSHHHANKAGITPANANTAIVKMEKNIVTVPTKLVPLPAQNQQPLAKAIPPVRSRNDEAILDLRTRIPEIEKIFDVHSRIGNGTFSTVLLGTLKKERGLPESLKRKFAIKHHIPTSHPERIMKELQCMAKIGGTDNVVGINCCIRYNESIAFIMPYLQHDRFHDFYGKMDLEEVQFYMKNLLIALRHVHQFNVIHRDVKPSNFLYNRRKRQFLLVDFGLAQQVHVHNDNIGLQTETCAALPLASSNEGKRKRDSDVQMDASKAIKKIRCTGPDGDQQISSAMSFNNQTVNGSSVTVRESTFKMPLKQLNEITPGKLGSSSTLCPTNGIYEAPTVGRPVKTTINTVSANTRSSQKNRSGTRPDEITSNNNINTSNKTDAVRNVVQPVSKCQCYGNPQVCNICLIKKEIHASRAGTPGYRPPEVLLKYADQTTAVDIWAVGVIFLSILSSVYPFFKAPNDYVALAEMVTIFGDKTIRKTAFLLDRLVTLSQRTKPLDLRKLCVRFRNRIKFSSPELLRKYENANGPCEVCNNCDQFYFNCLCLESQYKTEPLDDDDPFPASAYDLLYKLLEVNPHKRITAAEALNHPFFVETISKHFDSNKPDTEKE